MDITAIPLLQNRKTADILVLPFFKGRHGVEKAGDFLDSIAPYRLPIETKDFKAKEGEVILLYHAGKQENRIALLGLGDPTKVTVETLRRAYSCLTKACHAKKIRTANVVLPRVKSLASEEVTKGIVEGVLLSNYAFTILKHDLLKKEPVVLLQKLCLLGTAKRDLIAAEKALGICQGVYFARDLVNGNADDVTPQYLAKVAKELAEKHQHVKTKILGKKEIEKEKMGLLLAVNRGSHLDPAFIVIEYKGNPKSKDNTVIVGKGITYDTGGLNLKPTGSMETMKCDMGGAAAVLGTIKAAALLELEVNLIGIIPSTENAMSSTSYKPGDVYVSASGKTVEIGNTDAEGRLVLADALTYIEKHLKPTRIIDFATLTGAIDVALGPEASGLFCNDDALANGLLHAGLKTHDRLWRMPIFDEYRDQLKSEIADIKNVGGRSAGSITAALFLKEFIPDVPWAHLDIASTAYLSEHKRYNPKFGTGVGVRLMIDFLEHLK